VVVGMSREIGGRYLGADRQTDSYFYLGKGWARGRCQNAGSPKCVTLYRKSTKREKRH
jgi:hypothetical protein